MQMTTEEATAKMGTKALLLTGGVGVAVGAAACDPQRAAPCERVGGGGGGRADRAPTEGD